MNDVLCVFLYIFISSFSQLIDAFFGSDLNPDKLQDGTMRWYQREQQQTTTSTQQQGLRWLHVPPVPQTHTGLYILEFSSFFSTD